MNRFYHNNRANTLDQKVLIMFYSKFKVSLSPSKKLIFVNKMLFKINMLAYSP